MNNTEAAKFFKYDAERKMMVFVGNTLTLRISTRWDRYGGLQIGNGQVTAMAIGDMVIDDKFNCGLMIAGITKFFPRQVREVRAGDDKFVELSFETDDRFMDSVIVQNPKLAYACFYELEYLGTKPRFLDYRARFDLFDQVSKITGVSFPVDHVTFELIAAVTYRQPDDLATPRRFGEPTNPEMHIPLKEVVHLSGSTPAKLVGSYFGNAVDAALVHPATTTSPLDEILRQ